MISPGGHGLEHGYEASHPASSKAVWLYRLGPYHKLRLSLAHGQASRCVGRKRLSAAGRCHMMEK